MGDEGKRLVYYIVLHMKMGKENYEYNDGCCRQQGWGITEVLRVGAAGLVYY